MPSGRLLRPLGSAACLSKNFETENRVFLRKAQTLHQCRVKEDEAWKKSQVDPVVKQLQAADKRQDRSNFVRFARRRTTCRASTAS